MNKGTHKNKWRTGFLKLSLLFGVLVFLSLNAASAEAAKYKVDSYYDNGGPDGSVNVTYADTGKLFVRLKIDGESINSSCWVTSKYIYFSSNPVSAEYGAVIPDSSKCSLYRYDCVKKTYSLQKNLGSGFYDVDYLYDGNLYLSKTNGESLKSLLYKYNIKTKSLKKAADGKVCRHYKHNIIMDEFWTSPSVYLSPVRIYNIKTGKTRTLAKEAWRYDMEKQYLYIASVKSVKKDPRSHFPLADEGARYKIFRYNLLTGKSNTLVPSMKAYRVAKVTPSFVYHFRNKQDSSGNSTRVYYRYQIKTKKQITMSKDSFSKAVGWES